MNGKTEKENSAEKRKIECPMCEKEFQDMRGLTSHARHFHEMTKEEIENERIKKAEKEDSMIWKIVGGISLTILTLVTD